jgi:hypothetical protein
MEQLFLYLVKSSLIVSIFFGIYRIFLKRETFYKFNRIFLLWGLIASIILPLISFNYQVIQTVPEVSQTNTASTNLMVKDDPIAKSVGVVIYLIGLAFFMMLQLISLWKANRMLRGCEIEMLNDCKVIRSDRFKTSFSIFNFIILDVSGPSSLKEQQLILAHEMAHVKGKHWLDLLIAQLFCCLNWFNPIAWLYFKDTKQNHEFLADEEVLRTGHSGPEYRATLLNQTLKVPVFKLSNTFASCNPLKRVQMMLKKPSNNIRKWTTAFACPFLVLVISAFAKPVYIVKVPAPVVAQQKPDIVKAVDEASGLAEVSKINSKRLMARLHEEKRQSVIISPIKTFDSSKSTDTVPAVNTTSRQFVTSELSNPPLYIINGIEVSSLDDLAPDEIASINVLKGKNGVLLHGPRAANGVIIVTTKAPVPVQ